MKTLILAEGKDDQMVLRAMAEHWRLEHLDIRSYDGRDKLPNYLANFSKSPEYTQGKFDTILITRDNDDAPEAAWQSLADHVSNKLGLTLSEPGTGVRNDFGTSVAAYCIPEPGKAGMIESLCLQSLGTDQRQKLNCVQDFMDCLSAQLGEPVHEKIRFTTWLLTSGKPRFNLKKAIEEARFDFESECFRPLKRILSNRSQS